MLTYTAATPEQYDIFLQMMWEDGQEYGYLETAMKLMQMTWEEYAQLFRTRGQVRSIFDGERLAGFYWIEERGDTLHLHGLILNKDCQGKGIGTAVLTMLAKSYTGKMDKIELGVYKANAGAIKLYEKTGFNITNDLSDLGFFIMQKSLIQKSTP